VNKKMRDTGLPILILTSAGAVGGFLYARSLRMDQREFTLLFLLVVLLTLVAGTYYYRRLSGRFTMMLGIAWLLVTGGYLVAFHGPGAGALAVKLAIVVLLAVSFGDWLRLDREGPTRVWKVSGVLLMATYLVLFNVLGLRLQWEPADRVLQGVAALGTLMMAMDYWCVLARDEQSGSTGGASV
jgi:hypothetical protein